MQVLGNDSLAGAVVAGNQHIRVGRPNAADHLEHRLHRLRLGHKPLGVVAAQVAVLGVELFNPPLRLAGSAIVDPQRCPSIADPGRSLLGEDQERWLAEGWDLERRWNLLALQTLLSPLRTAEGRVWTDGWDGYPAARLRLLQAVAQRQVPGGGVLGGDRHAHFVSDVHERPEDARSPRLASEFCGTSISSLGPRQDRLDAALAHNPHLLHARGDRRGFVALELGRDRLQARLMAVDNALDPASTMHEQARFIVDPRRPGPQRA